MIKLEIKSAIYAGTPDMPFDRLLLAVLYIVACFFPLPPPHPLSILHSAYNIYSHISILLRKDQSFSPYAVETYNIYHRL